MITNVRQDGTKFLTNGDGSGTLETDTVGLDAEDAIHEVARHISDVLEKETAHDKIALDRCLAAVSASSGEVEIIDRQDSVEITRSAKGDISFKVKAYGVTAMAALEEATKTAAATEQELTNLKAGQK